MRTPIFICIYVYIYIRMFKVSAYVYIKTRRTALHVISIIMHRLRFRKEIARVRLTSWFPATAARRLLLHVGSNVARPRPVCLSLFFSHFSQFSRYFFQHVRDAWSGSQAAKSRYRSATRRAHVSHKKVKTDRADAVCRFALTLRSRN